MIIILLLLLLIIIILIREVRSGEETSGNPRAYTERSPLRWLRVILL